MDRNLKGFTLVELLVVISIIGLLSSVVYASLNAARAKARDARRESELSGISKALELWYQGNNSYPSTVAFSVWNSTNWGNGNVLFNALVTTDKYFSASLPSDPVNKEGGVGNYLGDNAPTDQGYVYVSNGQSYILGTNLENNGGAKSDCGNYQIYGGTPGYGCPL